MPIAPRRSARRERPDVEAVERDPALVHVPEPRQQRHQRGLAPARRTHQRHHLARRDRERDVDPASTAAIRSGLIAEGHVLERHLAPYRRGQRRRGCAGPRSPAPSPGSRTPARRRRPPPGTLVNDVASAPIDGRDRDRVEQEPDQRARRQPPVQHQQAALPEHEDDRREGRERQHPEEHAAHPRALERGPHARRHPLAVPRPLGRLLHEALDRADLGERLLGHAGGLGNPVLHAHRHAAEPAPEHDARCRPPPAPPASAVSVSRGWR